MKPPSRRRTEPSRFRLTCDEEKQATGGRTLCKGWSRKDQQNLLQALKRQQNFESELDLNELQKKVPTHSLEEIGEVIKTLKSRVLQKVLQQVQSQRKEEGLNLAPIEIWSELVDKVSGSHGKTVSAAFSQMLVIAATEPCSLLCSVPPQAITIQSPARSSHPVPILPKPTPLKVTVLPRQVKNSPKSSSTDVSSKTGASTSSAASSTSSAASSTSSAASSTSSAASSTSSAASSTSSAASSLIQPDSRSSDVEHTGPIPLDKASSSSVVDGSTPTTPTPESSQVTGNPVQPESEPQATASGLSAGLVSPSVSLPSNQGGSAQPSDLSGRQSVVNFDNIYEYLADIEMKPCESALTSMESAVLLDLLMCLPEELQLLDCTALQRHLLQVHSRLTQPVKMPAASSKTDGNIPHANPADSAALTNQHNTSTGSGQLAEALSSDSVTEPTQNKADWASAGTCPLNPLLIPLALLKRRSLGSEK